MRPQFASSSGGDFRPVPLPANYRRVVLGNGKTPAGRRLLGSFVSAMVGWFSLTLVFLVLTVYRLVSDFDLERLLLLAIASGVAFVLVFGTWLIFLIPLYLHVPRTWVLWRWPVCTVCGALAGGGILIGGALFLGAKVDHLSVLFTALLAAFTGGATCLHAALTAPRYHDPKHPENLE